MPYLLNLLYLLLLLLAFPWLLWQAVRKGKYRRGYGAKFLGLAPRRESEKTCLWFHAVSVGEVNLLAPLLKRIQATQPDWECVVSTTTLTGMELAKKKYPDRTVFYCPLDFSWAVAAAMRRIRPDVLALAELELWPNLVRAAKKHGAKVAVINGRLSEKSYRGYRRIRWFTARMLRKMDLIAVQDETYARRFRDLGARTETVHVTGSMKYDGAQTDRRNPATRRLAALAGIADQDVVFLAGSTQEPEEAAVLEVFQRLRQEFPKLRLLLVPRHPERFPAVAKLLDQSGVPWQRRTALDQKAATDDRAKRDSGGEMWDAGRDGGDMADGATIGRGFMVLLVDVVGELGAWWGAAQIAFVGGSFGSRGGQNMIEPAAYGVAVSFGPNTWNFRDVVTAMLDRDAAVVVKDQVELVRFVRRCLADPDYAAELGRRAQALVQSQMGATERTMQFLNEIVRRA